MNEREIQTKTNTVQIQEWFVKHYNTSTPSETTICRWSTEFKCGVEASTTLHILDIQSRHHLQKNFQKIRHIVLDPRTLKLEEISGISKISIESVMYILYQHLH